MEDWVASLTAFSNGLTSLFEKKLEQKYLLFSSAYVLISVSFNKDPTNTSSEIGTQRVED